MTEQCNKSNFSINVCHNLESVPKVSVTVCDGFSRMFVTVGNGSYIRVVSGPVRGVQSLDRFCQAGHRPVEKASQTGKKRQKLNILFHHLLSIAWLDFKKSTFSCFVPRFYSRG